MFARHPLTGKPIRILQCEGTVWKNAATLVWLDIQITDLSKPWDRYTLGVSSLDAWAAARKAGLKPDIVCLLGSTTDAAITWLQADSWKEAHIIAAPKAILESLGMDTLAALTITNMVCLEELHILYPHVGDPWDGSETDARILLAGLLRVARTGPCAKPTRQIAGLQVCQEISVPAPLYFLTQYYRPEKAARRKEIDLCLQKNVENPLIDAVVLLNESADVQPPFQNPKLTTLSIGRRLNFADILRWIVDFAPADAIVAFANSDIYLDDSWRAIWSLNLQNVFLSLLRWDDAADPTAPPTLFGPRADSQDTWVVSAESIKARAAALEKSWVSFDIPFGKGGCDNAINVEMLKQKFLVVNPALTLITHHVHTSGYRTYNPHDIVDRPMYMHVQPTGLHDLLPQRTMPPSIHRIQEPTRDLTLKGVFTQGQLRTFHTMCSKAHGTALEGNATPPVEIPIYSAEHIFQTPQGLVGTYNSILIGTTKAAMDAWGQAEMSKVTPCEETELALIAPCADAVAQSPAQYILRYIGKILALQALAEEQGVFWAPLEPAFEAALRLFTWPTNPVPIMNRNGSNNAYCKKALIWHPQDGAAAWPTRAEVQALRKALTPGPQVQQRPIVCMLDSRWITGEFVKELERSGATVDCITADTPFPQVVRTLQGASAYVYKGGAAASQSWSALWALPADARVVEIQFETGQTAESVHIASVCDLNHTMILKARDTQGTVEDRRDILKAVLKAQKQQPTNPTKPTLLMPAPSTTGFFAHAGDSFRQLARSWAERGCITLEEREGLANCWLGGLGNTLLYDRPTMEWLNKSPATEKSWRLALFGNPDPRGAAGSSKPWIFWPRQPNLVEAIVAESVPISYESRNAGPVFIGKIENATQEARRTADGWAAVCALWSMKWGNEPYEYTHEQYLRELQTYRFGLCLAGYGRKCHREVECMAMGCVPICAPEVDMENYADPPVEGVHFLRAATATDVPRLVASISRSKWELMSAACQAWWRRNASIEGSWAQTFALFSADSRVSF